ncbi:DUF5667 domain-containing protein [Streptomyces sp. HSG2]|uniref:DUF5667 domain-containing protein n=1 Tax=Streptomyces sp. HSG2 TaxID=2797167 RepID=UPI00190584EE|nr:DUF5667 domain-containing protein [Streptomyces sp. HSG2]
MIANVSAHRRANAFAHALEEQPDRGAAAEQSGGPAPSEGAERAGQERLLALAAGLGALPRPELDAEVKVAQRARILAEFEAILRADGAEGEPGTPALPEQRGGSGARRAAPLRRLRPRGRLAKGLTAGGLSVGVAAGAFGGVAAASSDALPGDSLYGLKRGIEDFKRGFADDDGERGRAYLDQASTRLGEARRLMERDRGGPLDHESLGEVRHALSDVRHDASEGHRLLSEAYARDPESLGPMRALSAFSQSQSGTWGTLRERLPVQLGDVSEQVSSVFEAIDEDVAPLRSLLPASPDEPGDDRRPAASPESAEAPSTSPAAPGDPTAPAGEVDPTAGSADPGRRMDVPPPAADGPGEPSRSETRQDGLLGSDTGGLLDPPAEDDGGTTPSAEGDQGTLPEPDITLPPLLPGLLPGLGGGDTEDG